MRGAVFVDIEELAVTERDVPVPETQNEVMILDPPALYAGEGLEVGR